MLIGFSICGKDTDENWVLEGRRVAPILQRGIPQTTFLPEADDAAQQWASINHKLSSLAETGSVDTSSQRITNKSDASQHSDETSNITESVSAKKLVLAK